MATHTYNDLCDMMYGNFPALEQAVHEGADVNMLDGVDFSNLAVN